MNGLALAGHQGHAVFALGDQNGLAIRKLHNLLRGLGDTLLGIGTATGRLGEFPAIGLEQRGAAIDREIGIFGIDDHGLAKLARGVDDIADHPRGEHALGVVG